MIKKAIIPAAGYGTRGLPITKVVPKELFPIGVKPAIHYVVEEALASGIEEILFVVSQSKNLIANYFDRSLELEAFLEKKQSTHLLEKNKIPDIHIQYIRQPYARGLGDAILLGKNFVGNDPFAVLLPDEVIFNNKTNGLKQLIKVYEKQKKSVLGLYEVEKHLLSNYGVVESRKIEKKISKIVNIVEKPQKNPPSNLAVIGRYIFNPSIFSYIEGLTPGVGKEIQLTDAINEMMKAESFFGTTIVGDRFDISRFEEFLAANQYIQPFME
ncbi:MULTISPECIES: UTP--glucose-1-phosphate uridylyltransferase [Bacillaceae]|uniref:UTP--glucose-1-phosphate uridylyltransferase n=1 Tax=Peribacillus huizhouensis TaxID=1501239 RepID=A0ABR6CPN5_9BACI|nr:MULTISPECIES: UTP--glucose-1-phosphate uridylyltransferase [Bacillaceae]MBA9027002.1 UTP--glucose-1-phosphate uridylyltransferase [Peribacillus huizhouensis]